MPINIEPGAAPFEFVEREAPVLGEYSRARIARLLHNQAAGVDTLAAKSHLRQSGLHQTRLSLVSGDTYMPLFLGFNPSPNTQRRSPSDTDYGFYIKQQTKAEDGEVGELYRKVTDPDQIARGLKRVDYFALMDAFYEMDQVFGVVPGIEAVHSFNSSISRDSFMGLDLNIVEAGKLVKQNYAFIYQHRDSLKERPYVKMAKIVRPSEISQEEVSELLNNEQFIEELQRFGKYDVRSPRLSQIRIEKIVRAEDGTIDIPASTIGFVWRDAMGSRHPQREYTSYLGLEDSSEQHTANLIYDMLKANRLYRIGRDHDGNDLERSERTLLGSLVVRVEGRRAHLLTLDGKELRNPVALAAYMREKQLDTTNVYSETIAELYTRLGMRFPEGREKIN